MRLIIFLLLISLSKINTYSQSANTLQSRVKDQIPELYSDWSIDITGSKLAAADFVMKRLKFSKNTAALIAIESLLKQGENSFFDLDVFPLERSTITHYGTADVVILNHRTKRETPSKFNFIVSKFSTNYSIYFFAQENDDGGRNMIGGTVELNEGKVLMINTGKNIFKFNLNDHSVTGATKSVNKDKTVWNENGLKGNVKETFTKKYEITMERGAIASRNPYAVSHAKYSTDGLMIYSRESERVFFNEKTVSGVFDQRVTQEFRSDQNLTIITKLKLKVDKAIGESTVDGKLLNKTEYEFTNGRIVKEKVINYLNEVEIEIDYNYDVDGQIYSINTSYVKQEMSRQQIFKYLKFDDRGNWTERIIYNSYEPEYLEIREVLYF